MIRDLAVKGAMSQEEVLIHLATSDIDFYLTGSRFFGKVTSASDWDFCCDWQDGLEIFLLGHGFKPYKDYQKDEIIWVLFRHPTRVDVQICHEVNTKLIARDFFKKLNLQRKLTYNDWNTVQGLIISLT